MLEACRALHRRYGTEVTYLPVGPDGRVDPQDLAEAISPRTALVSIMAANNETGVLQPIDQLARVTRQRGTLFHTDAAQAVACARVSSSGNVWAFSGFGLGPPAWLDTPIASWKGEAHPWLG